MFDKPYELHGKHATYVRFLNAYSKQLDKSIKNAGIFATAADVYMIAPLIGTAYNRRSPVDTESPDDFSIFGDAIINRQKSLDTVYRLVMLTEKGTTITDEQRIIRAFREDENTIKLSENLELFHQYMRGGVEWLYEQVTENATSQEDYLVKIKEIVELYKDDFGLEIHPISSTR